VRGEARHVAKYGMKYFEWVSEMTVKELTVKHVIERGMTVRVVCVRSSAISRVIKEVTTRSE
jgi:hypothetical protein